MESDELNSCVYCNRTEQEVPLVAIRFQGNQSWICSQHIPVLIHKPGLLAGKLPGAERISAAEGH